MPLAFCPWDDAAGGVAMSNSSYFSQQIERCLRLAQACSDSIVAERLRQIAAEFQQQADQLAERAMSSSAMSSPHAIASNGSAAGDSNHG